MITRRKAKVRLTMSEVKNGETTHDGRFYTIIRRPQKNGKQWVAVVFEDGYIWEEVYVDSKAEVSKAIKDMNRMLDKCAMGGKMSDKSRHRIEKSKPSMSMGEAMSKGIPIVFTGANKPVPEVICEDGKEKEALETMEKMGLITLVRPIKMIKK